MKYIPVCFLLCEPKKKGSNIGCSICLKKTKESLNLTKVGKTQIVFPLGHKNEMTHTFILKLNLQKNNPVTKTTYSI